MPQVLIGKRNVFPQNVVYFNRQGIFIFEPFSKGTMQKS
jgi:hypothetical protein